MNPNWYIIAAAIFSVAFTASAGFSPQGRDLNAAAQYGCGQFYPCKQESGR